MCIRDRLHARPSAADAARRGGRGLRAALRAEARRKAQRRAAPPSRLRLCYSLRRGHRRAASIKKERRRLSLRRSLARLSGFGPLAFRLGDMFVELPAMSSHILLCISTMLRLLSISPVVQYSQLSEPFITKVIISKKLATIFQTAN